MQVILYLQCHLEYMVIDNINVIKNKSEFGMHYVVYFQL